MLASITWPVSENGFRGEDKIPPPIDRYDLKMKFAVWMKDGTREGYIFARQKYKLNVKSVGGSSMKMDEKRFLVMKVKKPKPTHWMWAVAAQTKIIEILGEKEKKRSS